MKTLLRFCPLVLCCGLLVGLPAGHAATFTPLGDLAGGEFDSLTTDISDDGLTVVGFSTSSLGTEAFRWTEDAGLVALSSLTGETVPTIARAVSNSGTIAGQLDYVEDMQCVPGDPSRPAAAMWTEDFGFIELGGNTLIAHDLAVDGTAAVGSTCEFIEDPNTGEFIDFRRPFHWSEAEGLVVVGVLGQGLGVSADGSVLVGLAILDEGGTFSRQAFRWTAADGPSVLGLTGPSQLPADSAANDISAAGDVVVGGYRSDADSVTEGFRWTEETGFVGLGRLAEFQSEVFDVSQDGSVIVGEQFLDEEGDETVATIWDSRGGLRNLQTLLVNQGGLGEDLEGWTLERANGISADGLSIVGFGTNPDGNQEGWLVRLEEIPPPLLPGDYNGNGLVEQQDLDLVLANWGDDAAVPPANWVNDLPAGNIDQTELDGVLANWGNSAGLGGNAAVPEPASLLLALGCGVATAAMRRRGSTPLEAQGRSCQMRGRLLTPANTPGRGNGRMPPTARRDWRRPFAGAAA